MMTEESSQPARGLVAGGRAISREILARAQQLRPINFLRRLMSAALADDVFGLAAGMAYQFLFALFPFLIFLAALVGFLGAHTGQADSYAEVMNFAATLAPMEIQQVVREWVQGVVYRQTPELLTLGAVFSLLGSSAGVGTLLRGLNRAHGVSGKRRFWQVQTLVFASTLLLAGAMIGGLLLYSAGGWFGEQLAGQFGVGVEFLSLWRLLHGPGVVLGLYGVLHTLYVVLPEARVPVSRAAPGALFATAAWMAVAQGFSAYVNRVPSFDLTYGSLGFAIVVMIWLYAVSVLLLIGGEINALMAGHRP